MYAPPSPSERLATGLGSIAVVALIGFGLAGGLTVSIRILADHPMAVLNLRPRPVPPETPEPPEPEKRPRSMKDRASAENRAARATPVVAPPTPLVVPTPIVAAVKPSIGMAVDNGASNRPGPGQGAGGTGDGLGGGDGGGNGGGGEDDDTPPRLLKGRLSFSDLPGALRVEGVERTVAVRYAVNVDGRVSNCAITMSSGNADLDRLTCQFIEKRFRFDPSRDEAGRPVRSLVAEQHGWRVDRSGYAPND